MKVESKRLNLLTHPLVGSLLHHKWKKFGQYGYFINLLMYTVFVISLTTFAFIIQNPRSQVCELITIISLSTMHSYQEIIRRGRECRTRYVVLVTWLGAVRMWLAQGAKHLIFLRTATNRGVFHEFYARFFINACFILLWSARVFGRNRARVSLHLRPRPQHTIWIERSHWSIFEFLVHDFPKTYHTEYIIRSILSFPPYYLLLLLFSHKIVS